MTPDRVAPQARLPLIFSIVLAGMLAIAGKPMAQDTAARMTEANLLYNDGKFAQARQAYSQVLSQSPENVKALNNRALALIQLGEPQAALIDLSRAVELEPGNGNLWNNRANLLCSMERFGESFENRRQAFYNGRFTVEQAQTTLRRLGYFNGLADAVWDDAEETALKDWTDDGCPNPPANRML